MKKIFLLLILLHLHFSQLPNINIIPKSNENTLNDIWKLEFNNGEEIKLKRGVWKKITLELTAIQNTIFKDDKDIFGIYRLSFKDENIISSVHDLVINPNETLSYSFSIGLKCQNYPDDNYEVALSSFYFPNGDMTSSKQLNDIKLNLKIDNDYTRIELEPLMKEMPGKSVNFFKLKKEIYNIDEIKILSTNQNKEAFFVNNIIIKPFLNRDELSEDNSINHGILFDYPFGTQYSFETKKEFEFELYMNNENEKLNMCFKFDNHTYEIDITKEGPVSLDDNVKKAILFNTEDKTSEYEVTNSIKIKTKIENFPSILTCQFIPSYSNQTSSGNNNIKLYNIFITKKDDYDIIVNDLEANTEYNAFCQLANTYYVENERQKIIINIGGYETADKVVKLFPSYDENRVPHCVEFTFKNELNNLDLWNFNIVGLTKCYYHMKKDENLISKALATILCQTTELTSKKAVFCAAPLPLYNLGKYLSNQDKDKFSKNFDDFINEIKRIFILKLNEPKKIIDTDISQDSIKVFFMNSTFSSDILYINFTVISTHKQPVQCFYNDDLSDNYKFSLLQSSINLSMNKNEKIDVKIFNPSKNKMYSLIMKCYNDLPNFILRYKTTGIMNKYTYVLEKDSKDYEQDIQEEKKINKNTIINCNNKKSLLNPRCLKEKIISIIDKLVSDLTPFLKEIENKVQQFSALLPNIQNQYLEEMSEKMRPFSNMVSENKTSLLEKVIEFTKYLTYKDCSIYSSGSSNNEEDTIKSPNYKKCRKNKQDYIEQIYQILKTNFNNLECSEFKKTINNELTIDIETNLKYVLILIDELSNNPESYKKGLSSFLLKITFCLQENFDIYLEEVETQKKRSSENYLNSTISAIKKDLIYIMLQALTNLPKVIHFDEIDGYINKEKTKTGLILTEENIKIHTKIIEFSKKLNIFGDELYDFSGSMFSRIKQYKGLNSSFDDDEDTINITNKNMILRIYSNYLLRKNKAKTLQILVFDSPIVSIKASKDTEKYSDTVNTFISIILYDEDEKEIPLKNIDEKYRPQILYLQNKYDSLKTCFYYNETNKELEGDGLVINENYKYNGETYIKCVSSHLTAFTAGTYTFNSVISGYVVLIIAGGILLGILAMVLIIFIAKKKNKDRRIRISYDNINSEFHSKGELLEE